MDSKNKKVSDYWGRKENTSERYGKGFHWVESELVAKMIKKKTTGRDDLDMLTYFHEKYLSNRRGSYIGISLGCGTGSIERRLQANRIFSRLEAVDLSEEVIKQAQQSADQANLEIFYRVGNLNDIKLEDNKYDVAFANSSLHHVSNLEHIIDEIGSSLKDDGVLFVSEYVGPSQFQFTEKQVQIINEVLDILPRVYRKRVTSPNEIKPVFVPPTTQFMNETDPSEAVRSEEIVKILKNKMEVVEEKKFGGTLLHMLLQDIVGNFNPDDPKDSTVLKLIIYLEDLLIREKVLGSDFIFMVLKKKQDS